MSTSPEPFEDWELPEPELGPTPSATLDWVAEQLGAAIVDEERLVGGLSSTVSRLTIDDGRRNGDGPARRVVLRRHTNASWMAREPTIPHEEARILGWLGDIDVGLATPTLLAADPAGEHCDVPVIVMTEVAGRPVVDPPEPMAWADAIADGLVGIHRNEPPTGIGSYRRWDDPNRPVPTWSTDDELWLEAKAKGSQPLPDHPTVFIHRDYHPNNLHWSDGRLVAVVDWLSACAGPVAADLAHCRWNLAILQDPDVAERFTDHYRSETGYGEALLAYDLSTILSGPVGPFPTYPWNALGRTDLTSGEVAVRIERWLRHLLG